MIHFLILFTSGQSPVDPKTGDITGNDIESQAKQVMENLDAVWKEAGSSLDTIFDFNRDGKIDYKDQITEMMIHSDKESDIKASNYSQVPQKGNIKLGCLFMIIIIFIISLIL